MDLDEIIKYIIWVFLLGVLLIGVYFTLKKIGIV
jgi:hypothetical protein